MQNTSMIQKQEDEVVERQKDSVTTVRVAPRIMRIFQVIPITSSNHHLVICHVETLEPEHLEDRHKSRTIFKNCPTELEI